MTAYTGRHDRRYELLIGVDEERAGTFGKIYRMPNASADAEIVQLSGFRQPRAMC